MGLCRIILILARAIIVLSDWKAVVGRARIDMHFQWHRNLRERPAVDVSAYSAIILWRYVQTNNCKVMKSRQIEQTKQMA